MRRSARLQSIVLRTIDVGEADRFCILFTRERGRLSGRAFGVRKPKSKMGGTLLPFRHLMVECSEREAGITITGAVDQGDLPRLPASFPLLVQLQQGVELLLALTEDDHPLPEVFDLLREFIATASENERDPLPVFVLRLLHLLGLLPATKDDERFAALPLEAKGFVEACTRDELLSDLISRMPNDRNLVRFIQSVTEDQLQRPLRSSMQ